ncbi:hypothetical protein [Vineibacter terrae]|uniref:hypothetical protein n=1 Tax=Vineibacter terrae TaxID=2586908 RepID=UPI002E2F2E20|nr:hypothetical protein [Vineibacter terrae]HEX2888659.1 hypothetical protein [Vineibacter terrae]
MGSPDESWLLDTGTGRLVLAGLAAAIVVVGIIAYVHGVGAAVGAAGVTVTALAEAARRTVAAIRKLCP